MAERTRLPTDLIRTPKSVTCGPGMWPAFVKAVASSPSALGIVAPDTTFSPELVVALQRAGGVGVGKVPLSDTVSQVFSSRVDQFAAAGVAQAKDSTDLDGAIRLCELAKKWEYDASAACKAAETKRAGLAKAATAKSAREEAAAKAKDARCEAATKQSEACYRMCDNQGPKDELGFPIDFNPESRCYEGCDRTKEVACR